MHSWYKTPFEQVQYTCMTKYLQEYPEYCSEGAEHATHIHWHGAIFKANKALAKDMPGES